MAIQKHPIDAQVTLIRHSLLDPIAAGEEALRLDAKDEDEDGEGRGSGKEEVLCFS